jgi:recyclin-1
MGEWTPEDEEREREEEKTVAVAPLVQFFELVHIGDTIQSMVQVYFEKELVSPPPLPLSLHAKFSLTTSLYGGGLRLG